MGWSASAKNLWVFPCGAYVESEIKPERCPLCARGVKHEDIKIDESR